MRSRSPPSMRPRRHEGCAAGSAPAPRGASNRIWRAEMTMPNEDLEGGTMGTERELESGASRLGEQSKKVLQDVRELGGIAAESVSNAASRLKTHGGELMDEGKERLHKVQGDLERYVSSHPLKSVLLALGAGAVIGMLVLRRPS